MASQMICVYGQGEYCKKYVLKMIQTCLLINQFVSLLKCLPVFVDRGIQEVLWFMETLQLVSHPLVIQVSEILPNILKFIQRFQNIVHGSNP